MNLSLRNKLLISVGFGAYQMLINLFFASYQFLGNDLPKVLYFGSILFLFAGIEFLYLYFLLKTTKGKGVNKLIFSSSFLVQGLTVSICLFLIFSNSGSHFLIYISSFIIASFLPTLIFLFYFIFKETQEKFAKIGNVSLKTDTNSEQEDDKLFHLENANGKLLLEVPMSKIICFEANDNYVVTYFLKNESDLSKSMERISLKKIEEMLFAEDVAFYRVHKSYLINPNYVDEVKGRAQAYKIKMKYFNTLVPVSRSYDISIVGR